MLQQPIFQKNSSDTFFDPLFRPLFRPELENVVHRLVVMSEGERIDVPDLPALMRFSISRQPDLTRTLAEVEAEYIRNVLSSVGGNRTRAAEILAVDRKTLREKLKKMGKSSPC